MESQTSTTDIFLSCFKCGRIVKASDSECPRCGMQFGPGTLFECPFCSGLVWRNASVCASCGTDLTKFSVEVGKVASRFDMDEFVDNMIRLEVEELRSVVRRVACPGCGLMIRGDETVCPRCDLPLADAHLDCPVCGEKISITSKSCDHCKAVFEDISEKVEETVMVVEVAAEEAAGEEVEYEKPARPRRKASRAPASSKKRKKAPGTKKAKKSAKGKGKKGRKRSR